MTAPTCAFATARFALVGGGLRERLGGGVALIGGWPRFWSYWFSAGVPAAGSY